MLHQLVYIQSSQADSPNSQRIELQHHTARFLLPRGSHCSRARLTHIRMHSTKTANIARVTRAAPVVAALYPVCTPTS